MFDLSSWHRPLYYNTQQIRFQKLVNTVWETLTGTWRHVGDKDQSGRTKYTASGVQVFVRGLPPGPVTPAIVSAVKWGVRSTAWQCIQPLSMVLLIVFREKAKLNHITDLFSNDRRRVGHLICFPNYHNSFVQFIRLLQYFISLDVPKWYCRME